MSEPKKAKNKHEPKQDKKKSLRSLDEFGSHVEKFATKTAESIRKAIDKALAARNTVLTIRVNDECNKKLNMLVDAGLFKSRSESAAFPIEEGIKSQEDLFAKITAQLRKMEKIKEELKKIVSREIGAQKKAS